MTVGNLAHELGCRTIFCCHPDMHPAIRSVLRREKYAIRAHFREVADSDDFPLIANKINDDDIFIWISSRPGSVSWSRDIRTSSIYIPLFFAQQSHCNIPRNQCRRVARTDIRRSARSGLRRRITIVVEQDTSMDQSRYCTLSPYLRQKTFQNRS